jgi:hypothetical protein
LGDWRRGHKKKDNKNIIFIFILVFIIVLILFLKLICKKPYQPATLWVTGGDSQKKKGQGDAGQQSGKERGRQSGWITQAHYINNINVILILVLVLILILIILLENP